MAKSKRGKRKPVAKPVVAKKPGGRKSAKKKKVVTKAAVMKKAAPAGKMGKKSGKPIAGKPVAKKRVAKKTITSKALAKKVTAKKAVAATPIVPTPKLASVRIPTPEALFEFYQANVHGKNGKHENAMQALRVAAEEGFARAQYELSEYCKGDEKIAWLLLAAEAGGILATSTLEKLARNAPEGVVGGRTAEEWRRTAIEHALHGNDGAGARFMGGVLRSEAGRDKAMLTQALAMFERGSKLGDTEARKSAVSLRRAIQLIDGSLADLVREIGPGLGFGPVELEKIAALVRPSKRGVAMMTAAVRSRLGGIPILPPGTAWPMHGTVPLSFIAEIDLGEVELRALSTGLPARGRLLFFVDDEGFFKGPTEAVVCRVFFCDSPDGVEPPVPEGATTFHPVPLTFVDEETLPFGRTALAREAAGAGRKPYWELWENWQAARTPEFRDGRVHRLLGHADAISGDMSRRLVYGRAGKNVDEPTPELDAAAARLRLLLQVDSESSADMMWGDLGRIFFLIDEDDLATGNFNRVSVVLQSA